MTELKEKKDKNDTPIISSGTYETIHSKHIRFVRIIEKEGVIPFIEEIVSLANRVLPDEYDEIKPEFFLSDSITSASGEVFDISDQWQGHAFLVFDEDHKVIGFTAGNISHKGNMAKGYSRITLVDEDYQREGVGSYLISLLGMSLIQQGIETIGGSTEISNTKMINLIGSFGAEAVLDGRFLRYEFDLPRAINFFEAIAQRAKHLNEIAKELGIKSTTVFVQ